MHFRSIFLLGIATIVHNVHAQTLPTNPWVANSSAPVFVLQTPKNPQNVSDVLPTQSSHDLPTNPWAEDAVETYATTGKEKPSQEPQKPKNPLPDTQEKTTDSIVENLNTLMQHLDTSAADSSSTEASEDQKQTTKQVPDKDALQTLLQAIGKTKPSPEGNSQQSAETSINIPNPFEEAKTAYDQYISNLKKKYNNAVAAMHRQYNHAVNSTKNWINENKQKIKNYAKKMKNGEKNET